MSGIGDSRRGKGWKRPREKDSTRGNDNDDDSVKVPQVQTGASCETDMNMDPQQHVGGGKQQQQQQHVSQAENGADSVRSGHLPRAYSGLSPLPQQHPKLDNSALPGCIVRQDFHCAVLADAFGQKGVDQCLSFHPNGLAVVQLAPTHPAAGQGDNAIVSIDFDAGGCNVLESAVVKGKKKRGALQLNPTTVICSIKTRGGEEYKVCTGISGELIQANKMLMNDPGLMSAEPLDRGWLVIVRLKPRDLRRLQDALGCVERR